METSGYVDIFATKGMEYVLVLGFLVALVFFWKFLNRAKAPGHPGVINGNSDHLGFKRCRLRQSLCYHQGHGWIEQEGPDIVRIGVDDFAQKLIGPVDYIDLPRPGELLEQGEAGWRLGSNSKRIDILSPVDGEVLAVNQKALDDPQVVNRDPYGNGWLLKARVPKMKSNMTNLLSGKLAAAWMKENIEAVYLRMSEDAAPAAQTKPISGNETAEELPAEKCDKLTRELLLCK